MIFQEKNSLTLITQKSEQTIELKNNEIRNTTMKIDELGKSIKDIAQSNDRKII
jgi:hypothetical protein